MASVMLSATGRVACGGSFLDMYGRHPPATIQVVHPSGAQTPPPLMSWSSFSTPKTIHTVPHAKSDKSVNLAGEHVALAFSHTTSAVPQELFFSVAVFRCDTWALEWAVRADSVPAGRRVCDVCCLSAEIVAFLVESGNGDGKKRGRKQLYIATQADVPPPAKRTSRQWRSFLSNAHLVETGFDREEICSLQALSATSCLILTKAGRLIRVTVSLAPSVTVKSEEVVVDGGLIALQKSNASALVVSSTVGGEDKKSACHMAVFAAGGRTCHVMELAGATTTPKASKPQFISLPEGATVERVEFAGPHILVVTISFNERSVFALSMTCFVPPESSLSSSLEGSFHCVTFDPVRITAHRVPLGTMYCAERETHIVLASRRPHRQHLDKTHPQGTDIVSNRDAWWSSLEYVELPLHEGPYTEEVLEGATWRSVSKSCCTPLPLLKGDSAGLEKDDRDEDSNDEDDLAVDVQEMELLDQRHPGGNWERLLLHYPLSTCKSHEGSLSDNENILVNVLAIETAPFLHTRLVKQWHNATHGLRCLFGGTHGTVGGLPSFAVAWNPRHVRRALRRFSQEGLSQLFAHMTNALRVSTQEGNAANLFYGAAATAVTDVALHVITLSRQVGAILSPEDVAVIALLLRASREAGHLIVNHTTRGRLLLESVVKNRLANCVLEGGERNRRTSHSGEATTGDDETGAERKRMGDEEEKEEDGAVFLHVPAELRVERTLHTRYAANAWAQQLLSRRTEHASVVAGALEHLRAVASLQPPLPSPDQHDAKGDERSDGAKSHRDRNSLHLNEEMNGASMMLPDWMTLGRRAHADFAFSEYESVLIRTADSKRVC